MGSDIAIQSSVMCVYEWSVQCRPGNIGAKTNVFNIRTREAREIGMTQILASGAPNTYGPQYA